MLIVTSSSAQSAEKTIDEILKSPLTIHFESGHVKDVLGMIESTYKVNIILDRNVVAPEVPRGVVADGMVETIDLKDQTVATALKAILEPLHLDYMVRDNYIWVSSVEEAKLPHNWALETREYTIPSAKVPDVNAAVHNNPPPEVDIIALIARIVPIQDESGTDKSYVRFNPQTNKLVVHDSPPNLIRVQKLLDLIFEASDLQHGL